MSLSSGTRLGVYEIIEQIGLNGSTNQGSFYDLAPDGQRFFMIMPQQLKSDANPAPPTIVLNWVPRSRHQN